MPSSAIPVSRMKCPVVVKSPGRTLQMMGRPSLRAPVTADSVKGSSSLTSPQASQPVVIRPQLVTPSTQYPSRWARWATAAGVMVSSPVSPAAAMARQVGPQPVTASRSSPYRV